METHVFPFFDGVLEEKIRTEILRSGICVKVSVQLPEKTGKALPFSTGLILTFLKQKRINSEVFILYHNAIKSNNTTF